MMAERASKIFAMTSHSILEGAGLARESGHERYHHLSRIHHSSSCCMHKYT